LNIFSRSGEHRIFIEGGNELVFEGGGAPNPIG
jgi:hypothetical protein